MKQIHLIIIFSIISNFTFGQINVDLIKKRVTENPQENFHSLMDIFRNNPSKLTQEELNQIYYGSRFVKNNYALKDYNTIMKKFGKKQVKNFQRIKPKKF